MFRCVAAAWALLVSSYSWSHELENVTSAVIAGMLRMLRYISATNLLSTNEPGL